MTYPKHYENWARPEIKRAGFIAHCVKNMVKNGLSLDAICNWRAYPP